MRSPEPIRPNRSFLQFGSSAALASLILVTSVITLHALQADKPWLELQDGQFTVWYRPGYGRDAEFVSSWLRRVEELMATKYALSSTGYHVDFYLHSEPMQYATVGRATNVCCTGKTATIHYLAPSAVAWKTTAGATSLGFAYDENYHAKVITHEYISMAHVAAQDARINGGWMYRSAPRWFWQGLQEYDAVFGSSAFNRETVGRRLLEVVRKKPMEFTCCQDGLPTIVDETNGGAAFAWFLSQRLGDDVHNRILRSFERTFAEALAAEIRPIGIPELFAEFAEWLRDRKVPSP
jgi:hypothetical protein